MNPLAVNLMKLEDDVNRKSDVYIESKSKNDNARNGKT